MGAEAWLPPAKTLRDRLSVALVSAAWLVP